MFKKFRRAAAVGRLVEEEYYKQVLEELERGEQRAGLWAKALANSDGKDKRARSLYIRYRVQSLKDEMEVVCALSEQRARNRFFVEGKVESNVLMEDIVEEDDSIQETLNDINESNYEGNSLISKYLSNTLEKKPTVACRNPDCIGIIGDDGRCKKCFRLASEFSPPKPKNEEFCKNTSSQKSRYVTREEFNKNTSNICKNPRCFGMIDPKTRRCNKCGRVS